MSRWIPRIPGPGGGGGPPPPQTQDHQAPKYIVGNAPAGDTIFVCDFLDPGNGSGVAAAIAAALAVPGDIWVRPGYYDFGAAAAPALPLTLPTNVRMRGACGLGDVGALTVFADDTVTTQDMLIVGNGASVEDIFFLVPEPAGAAAGVGIVQLVGTHAAIRRYTLSMSAIPATSRGVTTGGLAADACSVEDCEFALPSTPNVTVGDPYAAIILGDLAIDSAPTNGEPTVRNVRVLGGEVAVVFLSIQGGQIDGVQHLQAVPSQQCSSVAWRTTAPTGTVRGCRISNIAITGAANEDPSFFQPCVVLQSDAPGDAVGFELSNIDIVFEQGGNPLTTRIGVLLVSALAGNTGQLVSVAVSNVNVRNHTGGFVIYAFTTSALPGVGEVRDVRVTNFNAIAPVDVGGGAAGANLQVFNPGIGDKIRRVSFLNCDFALAPGGSNGIQLSAQVNNTIIVANQLTPAGGTAIVDGGTGTEIAHNITT